MSRMMKRMLSLRTKPLQFPPAQCAPPIPQHELVDEEASPAYNPKYFYPAKPGELLANHYQLLVKIGWGTRSTTWLAKDITRWQPERFVTLKIINNRSLDEAYRERDIEEHISRQNPSHRGRAIIRTHLDSFEVTSSEGSHLCLAYEPMREPLWILQKRFVDQRLPLPIAKAYLLILLAGLDYLHSECGVVHTDLKLDNILMTFENEDVLPNFLKVQINSMPMQYKTESVTRRTIYRCHNDFGPLDWRELRKMVPKIVDFGLATSLKSDSQGQGGISELGLHPIQPDQYRAPEVILGCGWSFSADIWNFGVLAWNVIERTELFRQTNDAQGHYDAKAHIAEMIALLGPPPKELLAKSDAMADFKWPNSIRNERGQLSRNGREYFEGPFFSERGKFLYDDLIPARKLEDSIQLLEEEERPVFLSFIRKMLTWLPEDRQTASELMEHPFLTC
ncbi:hypothetical protein V6Z88_000140 [Aspergillus fumigatus]